MRENAIVTYTQNYEDLILQQFFSDVKQGTYIEIGAQHPIKNSATKIFYESGWRGITIAESENAQQLFAFDRPEDTNLRLLPENVKATLDDIRQEANNRHISFVKISMQPLAQKIVEAFDWKKCTPQLVCVTQTYSAHAVKNVLDKHGYTQVFFDGVNAYYLSQKAMHRATLLDTQKLLNIKPISREVMQQLEVYKQQQLIDTQKLQRIDAEKVHAEKQSSWYEQAPLSWMLRKTAHSLIGAINARMTAMPEDVAHYQPQDIGIAKKPNQRDVAALSHSYINSVHYTTIVPSNAQKVILYVPWVSYRVVRKVLRAARARV